MLPEILTAITIVKTALDCADSMSKKLPEADDHKEVFELHRNLFEVLRVLTDVQQECSQLTEINRELKEKLMEYDNWEKTAERYELAEWKPGVFAFRVKEDVRSGEPVHYLCPNCMNSRRKSIISKKSATREQYECAACGWGFDHTKPVMPAALNTTSLQDVMRRRGSKGIL